MTDRKYLELLSEKFPTARSAFSEVINLEAILNLPKGTEHFVSDVHGEYDAFKHILNNCSGVIRERVADTFRFELTHDEQADLCTLIYYPHRKLRRLKSAGVVTAEWYAITLMRLVRLARYLSDSYTRSKVRKAMPQEYAYIIDELLHASPGEGEQRRRYHQRIIDSIVDTGSADDFIVSLASLVKRLAVDHLHLVGDVFDRGSHADKILDRLMEYHSVDLQWGNHDIVWMGAAAGSATCLAAVIRNNIRYDSLKILEGAYGISLRELALFAEATYRAGEAMSPLEKAISVILFKTNQRVLCAFAGDMLNFIFVLVCFRNPVAEKFVRFVNVGASKIKRLEVQLDFRTVWHELLVVDMNEVFGHIEVRKVVVTVFYSVHGLHQLELLFGVMRLIPFVEKTPLRSVQLTLPPSFFLLFSIASAIID